MEKEGRVSFVQVVAGETPKAAEDYDRNYGIRGATTLLSLDYDIFIRGFCIGLNHHLVVLDSEGVIRCRCGVVQPVADYCGKEGNPRCQGHDKNMMEIVRSLLAGMPAAGPAPEKPACERGPEAVEVSGGWSKGVRISSAGRNAAPVAAVDRHGNAYAAWTVGGAGAGDVVFSVRKNGSWSAPAPVSADPRADEFDPQLAVDGGGTVHAAFVSNASGQYDVWISSFSGSQCRKAVTLTKGTVRKSSKGVPMNSMSPRMACMGDGRLALVWYTWGECRMGARDPFDQKEWPWKDPAPPKVRDRDLYVSFQSGAGFQKPELASDPDVDGAQDHTDPAVAAHPAGGAFIAWSCDHPETFLTAFGRRKVFGHTLGRQIGGKKPGPIEPLSPIASTASRSPEMSAGLACVRRGDLWAVWDSTCSHAKPSHRVVVSHWSASGWSEPRTVAEGEAVLAPRIFAVGGDAIVVWEEYTKEGSVIRFVDTKGGEPSELAKGRDPFMADNGKEAFLVFAGGPAGAQDVYACSREVKAESK